MKVNLPIGWLLTCQFVCLCSIMAQAQDSVAIDPYEANVNNLREEMARVSRDIDDGVDGMLQLIIPLTDSKDSGNKVALMKKDAIESLRNVIDVYVAERQKLEGELARPATAITKPQIAGQVEAIDEKIDTRINEMMRISASMAEHKEFEKYEYSYDFHSEDYDERISEDYQQNQKVQRQVNFTRGSLADGINKSIASLKDRISRYERTLAYQVSPENTEAINALIADTKARLDEREKQLYSLGAMHGEAGSRAISKDDFKIISQTLNEQKAEIRASLEHLRRLKGEYDSAVVRMNNARRLGH
jgi:hypothetical protein